VERWCVVTTILAPPQLGIKSFDLDVDALSGGRTTIPSKPRVCCPVDFRSGAGVIASVTGSDLNEDALARALLGRLDGGLGSPSVALVKRLIDPYLGPSRRRS
jgi:hypothetical protein